jgi:5S rRNA maturation endonuclease (ribonuclease M5)
MTKWYFKPNHLKKISGLLVNRLEDLLDQLGVDYSAMGDSFVGPCPVHGGDNPMAWNIFTSGDFSRGNWVCYTRHCEKHKDTPNNILGFVKGVMKQQNPKISFYDTLKFCCKFLRINDLQELDAIIIPERPKLNTRLECKPTDSLLYKKISREKFLERLQIPAIPMVERGLSPEILTAYDIGICHEYDKKMYNRIVVPVYDEKHKYLMGWVGRSIFNQCPTCGYYHRPGSCPTYNLHYFHKWVNSKGFKVTRHLFNYWEAKPEIQKTNTILLAEGQWDVLKLVQAGIKNVVGLFGDDISDYQMILIEQTGAFNLVLLLDNDEAGSIAKKKIRECCEGKYNIIEPHYPKKDIGELNNEEIKQYIESELRKLY